MPLSKNVITDTQKPPVTPAPVAPGISRASSRVAVPSPPFSSSSAFSVSASTAAGGGLVPSLTSDTLILNPKEIRHKRLYRSVKTSARLHEQDMQNGGFRFRAWFVTLTYRPDTDWQPLHITDTLKCVRQWCKRQCSAFRYVWVSEVQEKRQAREGGHCLHYHVLIFLPVGLNLPKFDKRGWWPHGHTQTVRAKKPVSYMAKYASKGGNANHPKGARMHGTGGLSSSSRLERAWWLCPAYVRDHWQDPYLKPQRAHGGGWVAKHTGEWLPAFYKIVSFNPLVVCRVVADTS
jgi:hypothetical protein